MNGILVNLVLGVALILGGCFVGLFYLFKKKRSIFIEKFDLVKYDLSKLASHHAKDHKPIS